EHVLQLDVQDGRWSFPRSCGTTPAPGLFFGCFSKRTKGEGLRVQTADQKYHLATFRSLRDLLQVLYQADGGCPRWCSLGAYLSRVPPWWIFSIPLTCTSFVWLSGWQKCAATGLSVFLVRISERCPFILMCRGCYVSPTYCRLHLLHVIRYTRLLGHRQDIQHKKRDDM
ncbi:hypothetical protein GBAR_LOCUS16240, partial [Geodia barretti]